MGMTPIIRSFEARVDDVTPVDRSIVSKINTSSVDRYNTVILAEGIKLENYRRNPVVLFEHGKDPNRGSLPIGRNIWIKSGNGSLIARTQFHKDDYSQALFEMYRDGLLRGWSVNVLPEAERCSPPTKEEIRVNPTWRDCSMVYRGTDMAEYSSVAVPGQAEALTIMEQRGIWFPDEARSVSPEGRPIGTDNRHVEPDADDEGGPSDDDADDVERYITHEHGEYVVHAEDGKVLGKHKTEAEAKAQLAAVEAHKHAERHLPPIQGMRFEDIHRTLRAEIDRHYARQTELIRAWGELMRGRV